MILRELWIGPYLFPVKFVDGLDEFGVCETDPPCIKIREGLEGIALIDTTIHEVVHAINYLWGINRPGDEQLARIYGTSLTTLFAANPQFIDWIKYHLSNVGAHGTSGAYRSSHKTGLPTA